MNEKQDEGQEIKETEEELLKQLEDIKTKLIAKKYLANPPSIEELFGAKNIEELYTILKNIDLFEILNRELDKTIVGECDTKVTILLVVFGGRLVENCEPTSNNLMVNDLTGAGKDYIVKQILNLLPEENTIRVKRISEKVFTYWHNAKFEPEWTWDGKTFYNEDISNFVLNCDVFKVMSSSDGVNKAIIIINNTPVEVVVNGKPAMIITIATANPKLEQLRRYPMCNLDTTEEQTRLILKKKAEFHKMGIRPIYDRKIKDSLKLLKRIKVRVPFADKLVNVLSTKNIIIRTHFDRLIDYIKFSTAIHQYQREQGNEGYYLATKEDYNYARIGLLKTTSNIFSIPLTKNQQRILEILKGMDRTPYSVTDLEPKITFISDRMLRIELDRLTEFGFLSKDKEERQESKKPVMVYTHLDVHKIKIPTWEELQNISNVSDITINSNVSNLSNDGTIEANETNARQECATQMTDDDYVTFVKEKDSEGYDMQEFSNKYGEECMQRLLREGRLYEKPAGFLKVVE